MAGIKNKHSQWSYEVVVHDMLHTYEDELEETQGNI